MRVSSYYGTVRYELRSSLPRYKVFSSWLRSAVKQSVQKIATHHPAWPPRHEHLSINCRAGRKKGINGYRHVCVAHMIAGKVRAFGWGTLPFLDIEALPIVPAHSGSRPVIMD